MKVVIFVYVDWGVGGKQEHSFPFAMDYTSLPLSANTAINATSLLFLLFLSFCVGRL